MQKHVEKHSSKFILCIWATRKFTAFLGHAAYNMFYFPQNSVYFITLSFSVPTILTCFTNHILEFKYPSQYDNSSL